MDTKKEPLLMGDTTRELWTAFSQQEGNCGVLNQPQIRLVLNKLGLFPTKSQISEVVHWACESSGRAPVDHITFGEFCVLVTELQEHYRRSTPAPQPRSQLKEKADHVQEERRKRRRLSVFLGGSCNPTTWRHDVAIPYLKQHSITFYNPQVSDWKPELIEIEDQAKVSAEVLFFVIDSQTRSTSSMVEAAYLAGCGRQLILVIKGFQFPVVVNEEELSTVEVEDLQRSHTYLVDLVERMGIPVFAEIDLALRCTCKTIQQNTKVGELSLDDGAQPVKYPHVRVADKLLQLNDVFRNVDTNKNGRLSVQDVRLVYKTMTDEELPLNALMGPLKDRTYTFEDVCVLLAEYHYKRKGMLRRLVANISKVPRKISGWLRGQGEKKPQTGSAEPRKRDVFLGGSCGPSTWRDQIAIPILRKHGLAYFNPQLPEWSTRYISLEAAVKDCCSLLLYVITAQTRGITSMLEAGHFIGQGCNVVLCVQQLKPGVIIEGEKLSANGVKDYNRARSYLIDLANREGVPVFDNIEESIKAVAHRLRKNQAPPIS